MFNKKGSGTLTIPVGPNDHIQGPEKASITLLEYGDFECPHSQAVVSIIQELQQELKDRIRFVFRNFPLEKHRHAELASEAAEAAATQGKFWEMYQALFDNQDALEEEDLVGYAKALGLDTGRLQRELNQHTYLKRVKEDVRGGIDSGAGGTPEIFINGLMHPGNYDQDSLMRAILKTGLL